MRYLKGENYWQVHDFVRLHIDVFGVFYSDLCTEMLQSTDSIVQLLGTRLVLRRP